MRFILYLSILLAIITLMYSCSNNNTASTIETPTGTEPSLFTANAEDLTRTLVSPVLTSTVPDSTNVIYCASFQLAWNKLRQDYARGPVRLTGNPPFVDELNAGDFTQSDIAEASCLTLAGQYNEGVLDRIGQEMRDKFSAPMPNIQPFPRENRENSSDYMIYAYMEKKLIFANAFEHISQGINFAGTQVSAFGKINSRDDFAQQAILYMDTTGLAVELVPQGGTDCIYLAQMTQPTTLEAGWNILRQRLGHPGDTRCFGESDRLLIPKMNFSILRDYTELLGKRFVNATMQSYSISMAIQDIRFRLDERGAVLKSFAVIAATPCSAPIDETVYLEFDRPFLLCLKEKGIANPYFVMWVDNPELLVRQ